MSSTIQVPELIAALGEAEVSLFRKYHVRLRVDKVSAEGNNALCSAGQVRRNYFRADPHAEEGVALCHEALSSLYRIGVSPLISWHPRALLQPFEKIDADDPFRIRMALRSAGIEHRLLGTPSAMPLARSVGY